MARYTAFRNRYYKRSLIRRTVAGGDVTPDAVDWLDVLYDNAPASTNTVTFTGITTAISIRIEQTISEIAAAFYSKNGAPEIQLSASTTITINNNDTLRFIMNDFGSPGAIQAYEVYNDSDGGVLLDSFLFEFVFYP